MKRDVIVDGNDCNGRNSENTQSPIEESLAESYKETRSWNTCMPENAQKRGGGESGDFMKKIYDALGQYSHQGPVNCAQLICKYHFVQSQTLCK